MHIAISPEELAILDISRIRRLFSKPAFPIDVHSGREVKEFVTLAAECRRIGAEVVNSNEIERMLKAGEGVLKIGRTDLERDLQVLSNVRSKTAWNECNLEKVFYWDKYLKPARQIWSAFIGGKEDLVMVSKLFNENGPLFIKTRTKGNSRLYQSFEEFQESLGDVSLLVSAFRDLIISEPLDIAVIDVFIDGVKQSKPDECRHYIVSGNLIASSRAFECDDHSTHRVTEHQEYAKMMVARLNISGFADTYVLDTCRLKDQSVAEIEINNLFSAGIYDQSVIPSLAQALVNS